VAINIAISGTTAAVIILGIITTIYIVSIIKWTLTFVPELNRSFA
jgi:hypothetical protein